MKKLMLPMLVLLTVFVVVSCSSDSDDDDMSNLPDQTKITYTANVKTIISTNCNSCHGSPTTNGAPMMLTTYTEVKDAVQNKGLITRIEDGTMPPGGSLTTSQINLIKKWQTDGFID